MSILLDTGVLVGAVHRTDAMHQPSKRIVSRAATGDLGAILTTDHVLAEAFNFLRKKVKRRDVAEELVALVFGTDADPPLVHDVLRVHGARFAAALKRYRSEFDRGLSFTDWTSVVLMEEERIDAIATFDGGFHGLVDVVDGR